MKLNESFYEKVAHFSCRFKPSLKGKGYNTKKTNSKDDVRLSITPKSTNDNYLIEFKSINNNPPAEKNEQVLPAAAIKTMWTQQQKVTLFWRLIITTKEPVIMEKPKKLLFSSATV